MDANLVDARLEQSGLLEVEEQAVRDKILNITCGLSRAELNAHGVKISELCPALKPDGSVCGCPYSAHSLTHRLVSFILIYLYFTFLR